MVMVVVVLVKVMKMRIQKRELIEHVQYEIFDLFSQLMLHTATLPLNSYNTPIIAKVQDRHL